MFKLKDLIDEKKYVDNAYNRSKDRVGAEWGSDKDDDTQKQKGMDKASDLAKKGMKKGSELKGMDKAKDLAKKGMEKGSEPKQSGLGGGWDKHDGPDSPEDAVGDDPKKESAIVQGIKQMATQNRGKAPDDQEQSVDIGGEETTNLCDVTVPGTNMFCGDPLETDEHPNGIPRVEMPQLKSKPLPGSKAEKLVKQGKLKQDSKGEVNAEDLFKAKLKKEGIEMSEEKPMNVSELKATQNELKPSNIAFMVDVLMTAKPPPHKNKKAADDWELSESLREPIIVSKDGYILDGHHRWGALVALDIANGGSGDIEMNVKQVDADAETLVEKTNEFTDELGLETKASAKKKESVEPFAELYYRMKK